MFRLTASHIRPALASRLPSLSLSTSLKPTVDQIKQLRSRTMAGPVDCRKALEQCGLDIEASVKWLQAKGMAQKPDRNSNVSVEGICYSAVNEDRSRGILIEINSETDFVARNEMFQRLSQGLINRLLALPASAQPGDLAEISIPDVVENFELTEEETIENPAAKTVGQRVQFLRNQFGEKIVLRRVAELNVNKDDGIIGSYIHAGGKYSSLVALSVPNRSAADQTALTNLAQKLAVHVVGFSPRFIQQSDATEKDIEQYVEKNLLPGQKFDKDVFVRDSSLLEQEFVGMAEEKNVAQVIADPAFNGGASSIGVTKFVRWERGN